MRHRMMFSMGTLFIGMAAWVASAQALPYLENYGRHESGTTAAMESRDNMDMKRMQLKRIHVKGTIERITEQVAWIRVKPNESYVVELGPRSWWDEHHYRLTEGERISVSGWNDPYMNSDMIFASRISGKGMSITLAENSGRPDWPTNWDFGKRWKPQYDVLEKWYSPDYRYETAAATSTEHAKTASMEHRHSKHMSKSMKKTESESHTNPSGATQ